MKRNSCLLSHPARIFLFVCLQLVIIPRSAFSQVTLLSESFNAVTKPALPSGWSATPPVATNSTWVTNDANQSTGTYAGASGGNYAVAYNQNTTPFGNIFYLTYNNGLSTVGYSGIKVIYGGRRSGSAAAEAILEWNADGATWNAVTISTPQTTTGAWALINGGLGFTLPAGANGVTNLQLRLKFTQSGTSSTANYSIDDFVVTGVSSGPNITTNTGTFNGAFGCVKPGNSSTSSSFTVQGSGLTANLVVTPPIGFEIRTGSNSFSGSAISLTPSGGVVASTTIDVRFTPLAYERYSGNIVCSSTSAASVNVVVSGIGGIKSVQTGNWSNPTTWDGGSVPTTTQNVYISSTFPVVVDNGSAVCRTIDFDPAGASGLLSMGSGASVLSVYGDFNLGNNTQIVFSSWTTGAKLKFTGSTTTQTMTGFNSGTTNSGGIMELVVDKTVGTKLTTSGTNMKLTIGTSLEVISGTFELATTDDIFGRDMTGAAATPTITIQSAGIFTIVSGATQINTGSSATTGAIGKITVYGLVELQSSSTATPYSLNFNNIDVESGGVLRLLPTWASSTSPFNCGTITVKTGGTLRYSTVSATFWAPTAAVIMQSGSILNITTITQPALAPSFTDNGATWRYNFAGDQAGVFARTIQNLELSGGGIKTLSGATTVNGSLLLTETSSLSLGTGSLTYGPTATLQYGSVTQVDPQVTTATEWPISGATPKNVRIYNSAGVTLDASRSITGALDMTAGILTLGTFNMSSASVSGGSTTSFINTNNTGSLTILSVGSTLTSFPVGNGNYTPVSMTNTGTADNFSVNVGLSTPCNANALNSVNRVWNITEAISGGTNATLNFQWNSTDENAGFVRNNISAVHCTAGNIDLVGTAGAATGSGPYSKAITGVSVFSPFGITNSVNDISAISLVAPTDGGCKTSTESVTISIKNIASFPIDFSKNTVTVSATATGGYSSSIVVNTGTLLAGASQNVTMPATINMSAGGSFVFNASATVGGDINTSNDAMAAITITATAQPAASISYSGSPYCNSLSTPQAVNQSGTTGGTFSAAPGGLTIDANSGAIIPSTSTPGIYTVTYTIAAANGCNIVSQTASVTITSQPTASINYTGSPFCNSLSSSQSVTRTGSSGGVYSASPAGLSIDVNTGAITPSSSTPGIYTITYTVAADGGCSVFSTTASVTITLLPTATINYSAGSYCTNASATTPIFTGTTGGTYSASPAGLSINSNTGIITPSGSTPGAYTVTYTIAAAGGCALVTTTTNVTIVITQNASFNYGPTNTFCQSGTNPVAIITGTTGGTFAAIPAGLSIDPNTGGINLSTSALNSYSVTYTTPGPCAVSSILTVVITSAPSAAFTYPGSPYCSNGTNITPTFSAGSSAGVFSATPAGLVFVSTATGEINLASSTPGTYTITNSIAASGGCSAVSATNSITITGFPLAAINYSGSPFCTTVSTPQSVSRTGASGGTYSSSLGLTINSSTGAITPSTSTPGTYTVTYTIAGGSGCGPSVATTSVSINALPAATISFAGTPYCSSVSTSQPVTRTGTPGGNYSASPTGLSIDAATGAIIPSSSTPGAYVVTYTIAANGGCAQVSTTTNITITALPSAAISYAGPYCTSLTSPQSVIQTGTTGGIYSANPVGLSININTGAVTPSTSSPGNYTVTYTIAAGFGCASVVTTTSVTINAIPTATIGYASNPFCSTVSSAQVVTLTGTTGGSFSASPSGLTINTSTGAIIPSTSVAGNYTVSYTIASGGGCSAVVVNTSVVVTALPAASINYQGSPYCASVTNPQAVNQAGTTGGTYISTPAGLSINANTGAITPSLSTPGIYTVTYTIAAAGGCSVVSTTASVVISAVPTATINYAGSPFCNSLTTPQPITLSGASGGGFSANPAGLTISAITGAITPSTSTPGTYTVNYLIPAQAGCPTSAVTRSISVSAAPQATISYATSPYCSGTGVAFVTRVGTLGGTYSSTSGLVLNPTTGDVDLNVSAPGVYVVTYFIAAANGCAAFSTTASTTINRVSIAPTAATATPAVFCGPTNVNFGIQGGSLAPGAAWVWYSGSCGGTRIGTGTSITAFPVAASNSFFVRAEGGLCTNSSCASVIVTINTVPTITLDVQGDTSLVPGKTVTISANALPVSSGNTYQWFLNGVAVQGATTPSIVADVDKVGSYTARVTTPSGCSTTSAAKKITAARADRLWISPNPTTGVFQVRYFSAATVFNFSRMLLIYDEKGSQVYSRSYPITGPYSSMTVDFTNRPRGIYQIFIRKANGEKLGGGKLVVQ